MLAQEIHEITTGAPGTVAMREIYWTEFKPVRVNTLELHLYPNPTEIREWQKHASHKISYHEWQRRRLMTASPDIVAQTLRDRHVAYLNEIELASYACSAHSGKLLRSGKPFDARHRRIFVLTENDDLYVTGKHQSAWGRIQHSSLSSGKPVKAAGWFTFDAQGSLTEISNFSGHYHCGEEQMLNILQHLQKLEISLEGVKIIFSEDGKGTSYTTTLAKSWLG